MLLPLGLGGRRLYYDLTGPEDGPVVCITHSLASDGGSWAEQVPALLQAGFRVLRLDMRGHGGSDPVAGDYTMKAWPTMSPRCSTVSRCRPSTISACRLAA
jgi:3-oxoadipate enol-lactonase